MDRVRLARELVRAAMAFYEEALWQRHPNEHILAVRVPGQTAPMLASIMGNAGQQFGLCLYRGPTALATLRQMLNDANRDETIAAWDMLSLTMEPVGDVAPEFADLLREARFSGRTAPVFMAKEPGKRPRPMRRAEHETMLWTLAGMLAAEAQGLLRPGPIAEEGPAVIWTLTVDGRPGKPDVRAKFERYAATDRVPSTGPVLLPPDLKDLPRTTESWVVGVPQLPATIAGDDREMRAVLVFDVRRRQIVEMAPTFTIDASEVAALLFDLCRGKRKRRRGVPSRIDTDVRAVHEALAPVLAEIGVACDYVPTPTELEVIVSAFAAGLADEDARDLPSHLTPADDDLPAWKEIDAHVSDLLIGTAKARNLIQRKNLRPFVGPNIDPTEFSDLGFHTMIEWLVFHRRRSDKDRRTLAEVLLQEAELPPATRTMLAARASAALSLYRIADIGRGEWIDLVDILTGETMRVHDRSASETAGVDATFFARVYRVGAFCFMSALSADLGLHSPAACAWLEAQGLELTRDGLLQKPHLIGRVWEWIEERASKPIQLSNTHGEPLVAIAVSYSVSDEAAARTALLQHPGVEEHAEGSLVWIDSTRSDSVHLARIEFVGDQLVAEVNSENRLVRLRAWLAAIPGLHELSVTRRDFRDVTPDAALRSAAPEPMEAAAVEAIRAMLRERYLAWLDERIPALGGKTPREACRTADGRRRVARLIRSYPDPQGPGGTLRGAVPRDEMLRELGLDTE